VKNPTRHKLREAEYFLHQTQHSFENDEEFYWNLNAFLSAARSITFYMQKQYRHEAGFAEWYCRHQIQMKADPELDYLNCARVDTVHTEVVPTGTTREVSHAVHAFMNTEGSMRESSQQAERKSHVQSAPRAIRRFFPKFMNVDVIPFCASQLDKYTRLVEECEKLFLETTS